MGIGLNLVGILMLISGVTWFLQGMQRPAGKLHDRANKVGGPRRHSGSFRNWFASRGEATNLNSSRFLVLAAVLVFGGCRHKTPYVEPPPRWRWAEVGRACPPDAPAFSLPEALRDTSSHPFIRRAGKDPWEEKAAITRSIPGGFGGISHLWRQDSRTVIYLVDTTQLSSAVPALVSAGLLPDNPRVAVVQGRWTYSQLYDWFRYIHTHIRGVRVSQWTLDDYRNRLYYGVEDEAAAIDLDRKLAEMNAPCFLVAVEAVGRVMIGPAVQHVPSKRHKSRKD
jgi:hypothetical protein